MIGYKIVLEGKTVFDNPSREESKMLYTKPTKSSVEEMLQLYNGKVTKYKIEKWRIENGSEKLIKIIKESVVKSQKVETQGVENETELVYLCNRCNELFEDELERCDSCLGDIRKVDKYEILN